MLIQRDPQSRAMTEACGLSVSGPPSSSKAYKIVWDLEKICIFWNTKTKWNKIINIYKTES